MIIEGEIKTYKTKEEAIKNALADYGFQEDFEGKNCDNCCGWDGESRRCECGNRRVSWETRQDANGQFYVIAQAW